MCGAKDRVHDMIFDVVQLHGNAESQVWTCHLHGHRKKCIITGKMWLKLVRLSKWKMGSFSLAEWQSCIERFRRFLAPPFSEFCWPIMSARGKYASSYLLLMFHVSRNEICNQLSLLTYVSKRKVCTNYSLKTYHVSRNEICNQLPLLTHVSKRKVCF
jgi:hypothetical protein